MVWYIIYNIKYETCKDRKEGITKMCNQQKIIRNDQTGLKNNQVEVLKVNILTDFLKPQRMIDYTQQKIKFMSPRMRVWLNYQNAVPREREIENIKGNVRDMKIEWEVLPYI